MAADTPETPADDSADKETAAAAESATTETAAASEPVAAKAPATEAAAPATEAADAAPAADEAPVADEASATAADADADATADASDATGDDASTDGDEVEAVEALPAIDVSSPPSDARYQATGKRKTSVARVIITPGDGAFWINGRTLEDYFPRHGLREAVFEPLNVISATGHYNVRARIHGGGVSSQAGALRHGIAKALAEIHPTVRTQIKSRGLLKLDARQVERKKAGLKKARKKPQFSKR